MKKSKSNIVTALKYDNETDIAPKVIAKGKDLIGEKIKEVGNTNKIPIYKDEKLANQLYNLSIGDEIPSELYQVVAEVLSFIANIDEEYK